MQYSSSDSYWYLRAPNLHKEPVSRHSKGVHRSSKSQERPSIQNFYYSIFSEHGHPTPIFSKAIGCKATPEDSADVYTHKRIDVSSNSVFSESPNFMDFGLSPANTPYKLKSVIFPTTRVVKLTNRSVWIPPGHDIEEVTAEIVSGGKAYSDYVLKMSLKL